MKTILIIDYDQDSAEALRRLCSRLGYRARHAPDGPTGLQAARELKPDIILLDLGMPAMSGQEVCQALRQRPCEPDPKIIAITGYSPEQEHGRTEGIGFDHRMRKPLDFERLLKWIAA